MSQDDDKYKKRMIDLKHEEEDQGGTTGESGGQTGQIAFRDFLSSAENLRDDLLTPEERRRLISVHNDTHELRVKAQKDKRDLYAQLKSGKLPLQTYRQGVMGAGMSSQYKANPALANKAQFSGIDRQVVADPTKNLADTNENQRNELQNELRLRLGLQAAPKFNPKPSPFNR